MTLTYDALGRMTDRESVRPDGTTASSEAHWDYVDTGEPGAPADLGLLRSESSTTVIPGFTETFTVNKVFDYNVFHQVASTELQLP